MPVSSKMSPIWMSAVWNGDRRNVVVPSTVFNEGKPRKMADWIIGSEGSAGQTPPSALNWASVIHSIVNPFGAPVAPAVTSRLTKDVASSGGEDSDGGSRSTEAA